MFGKSAATAKKTPSAMVTDAAPCRKAVRLRVGPERIAPVRAAVLEEFQKRATLPGFRKGKAPAELITKQYAKDIRDETLHRAMKQALEDAVTEHQLKPVGPFEVSKADFTEAEGLAVEAAVEVEPAFPLGHYQKIPLIRPSADVTPQDLERALEQLRESMAKAVPPPVESSAGQAGAKAQDAAEEAKALELPPANDELAKDLGYETLEKLRAHVEAKLREQKLRAQAQALEAALCDALLSRHQFDVPAGLVGHQTERLTRDFKARLLLSGMPDAQVGEETAKFTSELRTSAERHVKLGFVLDRIAEKESLSVTQDELVKHLWRLSQYWKKDPAEVRKLFDAQGLWGSVVSAIRQEKTIAWLMASAVVTNGQSQGSRTAQHTPA